MQAYRTGRRRFFLFQSRRRVTVLAVASMIVACAALGAYVMRSLSPQLRVTGLGEEGVVNKSEARHLRIGVAAEDGTDLENLDVTLDGRPVPTRTAGDRLVLDVPHLADGAHQLTLRPTGGVGQGRGTTRRFTVDTHAPTLHVAKVTSDELGAPVTVHGTAEGADEVTVAGKVVSVGDDGSFSQRLDAPPARIEIRAADSGGNVTSADTSVLVRYPTTHAVHLSAIGWTSHALRDPIMKLVDQHKVNAVELDIKDETGEVGYDSKVPLARRIGAVKGYYDARKVIEKLHARGVRVIGRIVAFRDPVLAKASYEAGKKDRLVQAPDGSPYDGGHYGNLSFTNFADPEVRRYNIDLAVEAAKLGFDDILYDYVRRPDGPRRQMRFPGLGDTEPVRSVADFVAKTREEVRPHGAFVGASVFGVAATRPTEIAQDVGLLAQHADYIAPMVYPSHWGAGEYGVRNPNSSPYQIVKRSLADFAKQVKGTGCVIVPWLQDFSMGVPYGDAEVAAQIKAAADDGMDSFLLWDAGARYHGGALEPLA
jgi:hypothetical protein